MWSHTIGSSKPKHKPPPNELLRGADSLAADENTKNSPKEDMASFDKDGFSKTSRVLPSKSSAPAKKPATVAKAPSFARTTSSRTAKEETDKSSPRPGLEKRGSNRPGVPPPSKSGTPARGASRAGAGTPVRGVRSPTQPRGSRAGAGTPVGSRSSVISPKPGRAPASARGRNSSSASKTKDLPPVPSEQNYDAVTSGKEHEDETPADRSLSSPLQDVNELDEAITREDGSLGQQQTPADAEEQSDTTEQPGSRRASPSKSVINHHETLANGHLEQDKPVNQEDHEELSREISLRNETIRNLRREIGKLQAANENKVDELVTAQTGTLRSELNSVRSTLVDVDDAHRAALEKHDQTLREKEEQVERVSRKAEELQKKLRAFEEGNEQDLVKRDELLRSKDEEIQKLTSHCSILKKRDGLVRTKDDEIRRLTQDREDLQKKLGDGKDSKVISPTSPADDLVVTRNREIEALRQTVHNLENRLQATEKVKEQEVDSSVRSLRDEFRDLQAKHKRKIEELEASSSERVEAAHRESEQVLQAKDKDVEEKAKELQVLSQSLEAAQHKNEELSQARDQEIRDMADLVQDLEKRMETARSDQQVEADKTTAQHERLIKKLADGHRQSLREVISEREDEIEKQRMRHDEELQEAAEEHQRRLESTKTEMETLHARIKESHQELDAVKSKHKHDLDSTVKSHRQELIAARSEQDELQNSIARQQKKLRELGTGHDGEIEAIREKHQEELKTARAEQKELQETKMRHEERIRDAAMNHDREVEALRTDHKEALAAATGDQELKDASMKHEAEIRRLTASHEEAWQDMNTKHEREIKEAVANHKREVEAAAEEHRDELSFVYEKHQREINQASSRHEELGAKIREHDRALQDKDQQHQSAIEGANARSAEFEAEATKSQTAVQDLSQQVKRAVRKHQEEVKVATEKHTRELEDVHKEHAEYRNKSEEEVERLRSIVRKHEEEAQRLRDKSEAASATIADLESELKERDLERRAADDHASSMHQQQLETLGLEHRGAIDQLQSELVSASEEMAKLKGNFSEQEVKHNQTREETARQHEESLRAKDLSHDHELTEMQRKLEVALSESTAFQTTLERHAQEADDEIALLKTSLDEVDQNPEVKAEAASLRKRLEAAHAQSQEDKRTIAHLEDSLTHLHSDLARARDNAAVEDHLLKHKHTLATSQLQKANAALASLQKDVEGWQFQYAQVSRERDHEREESAVEVALLRDKLELAEMQVQRGKEDGGIAANEAAVERALLSDKLELAELQARKDRKTITALWGEMQARAKSADAAVVDRDGEGDGGGGGRGFTHGLVREELAMLERRHGDNLKDLEALRRSVLEGREAREGEWRRRAEGREVLGRKVRKLGEQVSGGGEAEVEG
ncbi:hypothetical protein MMC21_000933 [Puttea exsequens]|nr:hypothetical protein [Puttea exsequens]